MTALASCCSPSAFHICPEVRIIAGIEASMITSLGTCRFVMPRSESTIAIRGAVLVEDVLEERADGVPEDDRVRDLHHRRLQVHGEQDAALAGVVDLLGEEGLQRPAAHHRGVDDLA